MSREASLDLGTPQANKSLSALFLPATAKSSANRSSKANARKNSIHKQISVSKENDDLTKSEVILF